MTSATGQDVQCKIDTTFICADSLEVQLMLKCNNKYIFKKQKFVSFSSSFISLCRKPVLRTKTISEQRSFTQKRHNSPPVEEHVKQFRVSFRAVCKRPMKICTNKMSASWWYSAAYSVHKGDSLTSFCVHPGKCQKNPNWKCGTSRNKLVCCDKRQKIQEGTWPKNALAWCVVHLLWYLVKHSLDF